MGNVGGSAACAASGGMARVHAVGVHGSVARGWQSPGRVVRWVMFAAQVLIAMEYATCRREIGTYRNDAPTIPPPLAAEPPTLAQNRFGGGTPTVNRVTLIFYYLCPVNPIIRIETIFLTLTKRYARLANGNVRNFPNNDARECDGLRE